MSVPMYHGLITFLHILSRPCTWIIIGVLAVTLPILCRRLKFKGPDPSLPFMAGLGLLLAVLMSAPYWIFGEQSSVGNADDAGNLLQAYLSTESHGSLNWTRAILGGMDRWTFLVNTDPWAFTNLLVRFLPIRQAALLIIWLNVVLVFVYSWRIQREIWNTGPWLALLGSFTAVQLQGYWCGKWPDGHSAFGLGLAIIPCLIYYFHRHQDHPRLFLMGLGCGAIYTLSSSEPFHSFPALLISIGVWGLAFFKDRPWQKIFSYGVGVVLAFMILKAQSIAALISLFPYSARQTANMTTVNFEEFQIIGYSRVALLAVCGLAVALFLPRDPQTRRVMAFLGLSLLVPVFAAFCEKLHLVKSFRWHLLFLGNAALAFMAGCCLLDRLYKKLRERNHRLALTATLVPVVPMVLTLIVSVINSFVVDLCFSYTVTNTWQLMTNKEIAGRIQEGEKAPFRIVPYGTTPTLHFWGQYQGLESLTGYSPFIDKNKIDFFYSKVLKKKMWAPGFLVVPQLPARGLRLADVLDPEQLKLFNVKYLVSAKPFHDPSLTTVYAQEGKPPACIIDSDPLENFKPRDIQKKLGQVSCVLRDFKRPRPFYVYRLSDTLERVYFSPQSSTSPADKIEITGYAQDHISFLVSSRRPAEIIMCETSNPFWQLFVNGLPAPFYTVNEVQTGFLVKAGSSKVDFAYCPPFRVRKDRLCR